MDTQEDSLADEGDHCEYDQSQVTALDLFSVVDRLEIDVWDASLDVFQTKGSFTDDLVVAKSNAHDCQISRDQQPLSDGHDHSPEPKALTIDALCQTTEGEDDAQDPVCED